MRLRPNFIPILLGICLSACPPPPKPTKVDAAPPPPGPQCVSNAVSSQVCIGMFTNTGIACVDCGSAVQGCFDSTAWIYCTVGGCSDPACSLQAGSQKPH